MSSAKLKQTLESIVYQSDTDLKRRLKKLCSLSEWAIELNDEKLIELNTPPSPENVPMWRKDWFVDEDLEEVLELKKREFENGERIAFKVPVKVHEENQKPQFSYFKVVLEYDEKLDEADCNFIRDGITISGIKPFNKKGLRALVIIDDDELSRLLGDSENPAHTEWQKNSKNFKGKYIHGDKVISFVISSIQQLYSWLQIKSEGIEEDILIDFFSIQIDDEDDAGGTDDEEPGDDEDVPDINVKKKKDRLFNINQVSNGFSITNTKKKLKSWVQIRMAYSVVRGNPFKRYSKYDFQIDSDHFQIHQTNVEFERKENNILIFKPTSDEFEIKVTGFDTLRDLVIDAKVL